VYFEFQHRLPGQLEPDSGSRIEGFVFKSWMVIGQKRNLLDSDRYILNFSTDCLDSWNQTQESGLEDPAMKNWSLGRPDRIDKI
jgi:hypothetical protein